MHLTNECSPVRVMQRKVMPIFPISHLENTSRNLLAQPNKSPVTHPNGWLFWPALRSKKSPVRETFLTGPKSHLHEQSKSMLPQTLGFKDICVRLFLHQHFTSIWHALALRGKCIYSPAAHGGRSLPMEWTYWQKYHMYIPKIITTGLWVAAGEPRNHGRKARKYIRMCQEHMWPT